MGSDFPERVTIETTSQCNLNCVMCYTKSCPKGTMTDEIFTKVVNECAVHKVKTIVPFFRGEPFCDPKFIKRLQYIMAKLPWARIEIASNGTLITMGDVAVLCELDIDFFSISVDTGDRKNHDFLNKNVENVIGCMASYKKDSMFLQVSTVDAGQDMENIRKFNDHWKGIVDKVKVYDQHTIEMKYGKTKYKKEGRHYCSKLDTDMVIYFDGTVGLCCYDWDRKPKEIGSVSDSTIERIWNGAKYNSIRRQHRELKITDRVCKNCDMWR